MTSQKDEIDTFIEDGVKELLSRKKLSFKEKTEALILALKYKQILHKITDTSDEAGSFFNNGR